MNSILTEAAQTAGIALAACAILMPLAIRWSVALKLVDMPNERKLHSKPIPSLGGVVMVLSLLVAYGCSPALQQFFQQQAALGMALLALCITGAVDDRISLSALLRLGIQLAAAFLMAWQDVRLHNLHGFLGLHEIPLLWQYALTMVVIAGVTNAFNLIDGIDGLAGGIGLANMTVFMVIFAMLGQWQWMVLLLPFAVVLLVFLQYNWRPARLFMGDGGSLVLGFLFAVMGIKALDAPTSANLSPTEVLVLVSATMMLPALDTLRVFYLRVRQGRSPFSADKNHLHHYFVRQHLTHTQATRRVISMQVLFILASWLLVQVLPATATILIQVLFIWGYTKFLHLSLLFQRWYRFVKRLEAA